MSYLAGQKLIYYKKYKIDIWGIFKNTLQVLRDNTVYNCCNLAFNMKLFKKLLLKSNKVYYKTKKYIKHYKVYKNYKINKINNYKKNYNNYLINKYNKSYNNNNNNFKYNKIYNHYNYNKNVKINYYTLKQLRLRLRSFKRFRRMKLIRLLFFRNLWNKVFKSIISKKQNKIFAFFLFRRKKRPKVLFWRPFIYESREPFIKSKRYRLNEQFVTLRLIKLFYIIYSYRQLKQIAKKAKHQNGVFEQNYLTIIESKLPSYLYRTSFLPTLFESIKLVKNSNAWINKQFKPLVYYSVKLFDVVGFRVIYKSYIYWSFFKRLRRKAFLFVFSRCIYVSLFFLFTILIARFAKKDIINSFRFDYYRVATYTQ